MRTFDPRSDPARLLEWRVSEKPLEDSGMANANQVPGEWTGDEIAVLAAAVSRAPSVHNTQPWRLQTHGHDALLLERADLRLPRHDPLGRDRMMSCGAALANLRLAVRRLGWAETWAQFPLPERPGVVARVRAGDRLQPGEAELARYRAIGARRSHRARFAGPPAPEVLADLVHAPTVPGVELHRLEGDAGTGALARLLGHAAAVIQGDRAYLRELAAWTTDDLAGDGIPQANRPPGSLPWAGLVDAATRLPDTDTLARRLRQEAHLLVLTVGDGHGDHLVAGVALQEAWLAATALGLAASVLTQPLHVHEVRAGLIEACELAGYPQAVLRVGLPSHVFPPTPRRSSTELIRK